MFKQSQKWVVLTGLILALSACDTSTPSQLNLNKMRLTEKTYAETMDAKTVDLAYVQRVANHYNRNGIGDITLNISYDMNDPNAKALADKRVADYKKAFEREGTHHIGAVTVPIMDKKYANQLVVTYTASVALAPHGCMEMPGMRGAESSDDVNTYMMGCQNLATQARMIAHPPDLLGRAKSQDGDTTRYAPMINNYKTGTPNQRLEGYQASGIGG